MATTFETRKHPKPLSERYPSGWGRNGSFDIDSVLVHEIIAGDYEGWIEIAFSGKRGGFNAIGRLHSTDVDKLIAALQKRRT